ncbi:MAG: peptide chain release factor 1 [Candidatus Omnitrophota bacterium]|nr:MAG: peptide chain release factor 1 [Candidatus Omnitrophota bacterium]
MENKVAISQKSGIEKKLCEIEDEYKKLIDIIASGNGKDKGEILKRLGEIEKLVSLKKDLDKVNQSIEEVTKIIENEEDEELKKLGKEELESLKKEKEDIERKIKKYFFERKKENEKNAIMEIRAGIGGEEASLFATDLFRMYAKYCEKKNYKIEIYNSHPSELGGFKEIIFLVKGKGAYGNLKFERGVHRVQRIPITESSGRIHTSAATVAVFPEVEEEEIKIDPKDLKIETFRASGHGGQHVNKTSSAVRITHIPTGIVVSCQDERSQIQNRAKAMKILKARLHYLYEKERKEKIDKERKSQIGTGERSEKIRTYNFPQNRVTDHRINLTLYNLDEVMEGNIDPLIEKLKEWEVENEEI